MDEDTIRDFIEKNIEIRIVEKDAPMFDPYTYFKVQLVLLGKGYSINQNDSKVISESDYALRKLDKMRYMCEVIIHPEDYKNPGDKIRDIVIIETSSEILTGIYFDRMDTQKNYPMIYKFINRLKQLIGDGEYIYQIEIKEDQEDFVVYNLDSLED